MNSRVAGELVLSEQVLTEHTAGLWLSRAVLTLLGNSESLSWLGWGCILVKRQLSLNMVQKVTVKFYLFLLPEIN